MKIIFYNLISTRSVLILPKFYDFFDNFIFKFNLNMGLLAFNSMK